MSDACPVIESIRGIQSAGRDTLCPEALLLLSLAVEAQVSGRMPDLWRLRQMDQTRPDPKWKEQGLHKFKPNKKYPWFCAECGYEPHHPLKHLQEETTTETNHES